MYRYIKSSDDLDVTIEDLIAQIHEFYVMLKQLPKPESDTFIDQYYGSTPMYSVHGNMLELIDGEPLEVYNYGHTSRYPEAYAIRIGGAYKQSITDDLRRILRQYKDVIFENGWAIIDKYGTNYCTYGIGRR